jgi:hypothetical protein
MPADLLRLHACLEAFPSGEVEDREGLVELLSAAWHAIDGSSDGAMAAYKLKRIEHPAWNPPMLEFDLERHGATVLGSTRAHVDHWRVDTRLWTAAVVECKIRQVHPAAKRWDAGEAAREIAAAIREGRTDERLQWMDDGAVRVLTPNFMPSGTRETTAGRLTEQNPWRATSSWWRALTLLCGCRLPADEALPRAYPLPPPGFSAARDCP